MEISNTRYDNIKKLAIRCARYYGTRNPFTIFKCLNVQYSILHLEGTLGGIVHFDDTGTKCYVYINSRYNSYSRRILAAHELGHIFLHQADSLNFFENEDDEISQIKEYEADIFAMEFMPQIQPHNGDYTYFSPYELHNHILSKLTYT